jgi:excinuclease ABC subunit A
VLVVEHDEQMMRTADWLVDMGPGAGEHGGLVVAEGPAEARSSARRIVTGEFPLGRRRSRCRRGAEEDRGHFTCAARRCTTSRHIDVEFPVGKFVAVTGVSGRASPRSCNEIVYKALANRLNRMRVRPGDHESSRGSSASTR